MERFQRILAALDLGPAGKSLTEGSRRALDRAVWVAGRVNASLTLYHSTAADEYWEPETGRFVMGSLGEEDRRGPLEPALARATEAGLSAELVVGAERPLLGVIREVLRSDVDLVVAAKRTGAHTDERKVGAVARKLLRKCPCAVWLEDPRDSSDPSVILAATDLTAVGDRVVELAASVASALGAELHVVHATSLTLEAQLESEAGRREYERKTREAALAHIARVLGPTPMAADADLHVGLTSPTQAILQGVERLRAGLVVMGTVSRGGIPGVVTGNTAERLIDRLDCALLTVKPKDFVSPVTLD